MELRLRGVLPESLLLLWCRHWHGVQERGELNAMQKFPLPKLKLFRCLPLCCETYASRFAPFAKSSFDDEKSILAEPLMCQRGTLCTNIFALLHVFMKSIVKDINGADLQVQNYEDFELTSATVTFLTRCAGAEGVMMYNAEVLNNNLQWHYSKMAHTVDFDKAQWHYSKMARSKMAHAVDLKLAEEAAGAGTSAATLARTAQVRLVFASTLSTRPRAILDEARITSLCDATVILALDELFVMPSAWHSNEVRYCGEALQPANTFAPRAKKCDQRQAADEQTEYAEETSDEINEEPMSGWGHDKVNAYFGEPPIVKLYVMCDVLSDLSAGWAYFQRMPCQLKAAPAGSCFWASRGEMRGGTSWTTSQATIGHRCKSGNLGTVSSPCPLEPNAATSTQQAMIPAEMAEGTSQLPHKSGFMIEGTTITRIDNRGLLQGPNHVIHATATYFRIAQAFIRSLVAGNTLKHHQVTLPRTCLEHLYQGLNVEGSLLQVPIGSYGASGPSASGTTVTLGGE
jgi:hypothetical protein